MLIHLPVLLFLTVSPIVGFAQTTGSQDPVYGFDPLLYNGASYNFFPKPGTAGSQYLFANFDLHGSITLRGVTFTGLVLNYDIFNQQLVLKYTNPTGATNLISISAAWLESYELGGCHFESFSNDDTIKKIYQVLGQGSHKILFSFSKELLIDNFKTNSNHYFSEVRKAMFILMDGKITGFNSNRGFVKCYGLDKREAIKKYMRKNKIKVKKSNDLQMNELINYCSTLN
jgi:hypothetical protein